MADTIGVTGFAEDGSTGSVLMVTFSGVVGNGSLSLFALWRRVRSSAIGSNLLLQSIVNGRRRSPLMLVNL